MLDIQKFIGTPKIVVEAIDATTSVFELQYLPSWFGHTLGNALRRAILWYSAGWAITWLKINGASHEYHVIDGMKETIIDTMLNFKKLRFKVDENVEKIQWISQRFKWVGQYTAADLKLPSGVEIINEDVYLLEISDASVEVVFEYRVEKWYGYYSLDFLRTRAEKDDSQDMNTLLIDNDFKAVNYVKYHVEDVIDDFSGTSKDKLVLEIQTISSVITPQELLSFAGEVVASYAKLFIFDDVYIDRSLLVDYYDIADTADKMVEDMNIKTIPIDALPLSERTRNALIKNEVLYVEDLEKKRKSELLSMKWIWRKAVDEIIDSLENMWKSLEG
jgi:DNA-directed RNA polymerase subunit alpha